MASRASTKQPDDLLEHQQARLAAMKESRRRLEAEKVKKTATT
jgi:hypothetical protein